jgi:hypothetical protein
MSGTIFGVAEPPLGGNELIQLQNPARRVTSQALANLAPAAPTQMTAVNTNTATASTTLTAANVTGGAASVSLSLTGTLGAGANAQLPTVAAMVAALPSPVVGTSFRLRVLNFSAGNFAWTITTNTGWTLSGTMTMAQNAGRDFDVVLTSLTTATLTNAGGNFV